MASTMGIPVVADCTICDGYPGYVTDEEQIQMKTYIGSEKNYNTDDSILDMEVRPYRRS